MNSWVYRVKKQLRQEIHISRHIGWFAIGILVGTALVLIMPIKYLPSNTWFFVVVAIIVYIVKKPSQGKVLLILCAGVMTGLIRGGDVRMSLSKYEQLIGRSVFIEGTIAEDATLTAPDKQRLVLRSVTIDSVKMQGKIWVTTDSSIAFKRTDRLQLEGNVGKGFGTIPATINKVKIIDVKRPLHGDIALEVRDWFASGVHKNIDEPEASLGLGFLLGQHSTLPASLEANLRLLGLTHIIVASGYNLTILVRLARRKLMKISRYTSLIGSLGLIGSFILITGFSPSMSRAGIVASLSLFAWYYGRKIRPFILLSVSAAITVLFNPGYIWGDIGWYLSYLSFFGVIVLAPLLRAYFFADKPKPHFLRDILIETSSAQIMTLPIIAFVFAQYSPLSLVANVMVLPAIPFAMLATFVSGIASIIVPFLGPIVSVPAELILGYITYIVDWFAKIPWASGTISINALLLVGLYLLIVGCTAFMYVRTRTLEKTIEYI